MNFWLLLIALAVSLGISYFVIEQAVLSALQKHTNYERRRTDADA